MTTTTTRPGLDADPSVIIAFLFGTEIDELKATLANLSAKLPPLDDHDLWDDYDPVNDLSKLAKLLGLPSNPKYHQQPYDLVRLFPLPLRSDQSDNEEEIVLYRLLFVLWFLAAMRDSDVLEPSERLFELKLISANLVHYFGDRNGEFRTIQWRVAKDCFDWFAFTEGCFDLETGALIEREKPALREFEAAHRRDVIRARRERREG
jgi:hypothetical protein